MAAGECKSWDEYPVKADKRQSVHRRCVEAEEAALKCLDKFMTSFNGKDLNSFSDTYNFPTYRLVGNPPMMIEMDKETFDNRFNGKTGNAWNYLAIVDKWHHSSWDRRNVIWSQPDKVHIDCCFSRYRKDNSLIGVYESFYIVTKDKNGHWGVKLRSTSADSKTYKAFDNKQSKL